jgi:hypothetical protein
MLMSRDQTAGQYHNVGLKVDNKFFENVAKLEYLE